MLKTIANHIAIKPLTNRQTAVKVAGGFAQIDQKITLVSSEVVIGADIPGLKVLPGDIVFVKGESANLGWNKNIYKVNDQEFVLVPLSEILLVENK